MVRHTWRVNPGRMLKFVIPAIAPVASLLAWLVLTRYFGIELPPFLLFFPSVILVSLLCGMWRGMFTTAVSLFFAVVFLFPQLQDSVAARMSERVAIAFFCAICLSLAVIIQRYRGNQARVLALEREGALRGAELKTALESMTDAVFIADGHGALLDFNHAFANFHRYRQKEECPRRIETYREDFEFRTLDGSLTPAEMRPVARALRGETATNCEYRLSRKDTGETWIGSFSFAPIREHGSKIVGSVVVARDITEQKRIEETLRTSEIRYRTAFQTSIDAIAINRLADGTYIEVNQTFLEGVGCQREDIIGKTSLEIGVWVNFEDRVRLAETLRQGLPCRSFQTRFRRKNGEIFSGVVSASVIELEGEPCILSVIRDLSEAKQAEAEIRNLAFFDPLTGLSNRRFLLEQVRESVTLSVRSHRQRALLFIDLDHFKNLNDSLGYQTGDMVLREVAKRLNGAVRDSDTVSRLAGDEFVVLIEDLSDTAEAAATQALNIAKSILARVDRPYVVDGHESAITCSIGITVFGDRLDDVNEILQQADIAMYQAKSAGRNTVRFFAPALQAAVNARGALEEGLRLGLRANEFELYYQPQFEGGRICGVEALLRWNHPTLGLLSPGTFIPLAEETRLIIPLGNWILDAACRQLKAWGRPARRRSTSRGGQHQRDAIAGRELRGDDTRRPQPHRRQSADAAAGTHRIHAGDQRGRRHHEDVGPQSARSEFFPR